MCPLLERACGLQLAACSELAVAKNKIIFDTDYSSILFIQRNKNQQQVTPGNEIVGIEVSIHLDPTGLGNNIYPL